MRDPLDRKTDPNPHRGEIDAAFRPIEDALANFDGADARRRMLALYDDDRPVWNGCRVRIRKWFVSWFRSRGLGTWDRFANEDFSHDAFTAWIRALYTDRAEPDNFGSDDLPYLLQELAKHARVVDEQRSAARTGANVPTSKIEDRASGIGRWPQTAEANP